MGIPLTIAALRALAGGGSPDRSAWSTLLADECALRIGSRPSVYGRPAVEADLDAFLQGVRTFGRCGCEVLGGPAHWLIESDVTFTVPPAAKPHPCTISVRTARGLVYDLRFYIDLSDVAANATR